jgi:hypothetical protein
MPPPSNAGAKRPVANKPAATSLAILFNLKCLNNSIKERINLGLNVASTLRVEYYPANVIDLDWRL